MELACILITTFGVNILHARFIFILLFFRAHQIFKCYNKYTTDFSVVQLFFQFKYKKSIFS